MNGYQIVWFNTIAEMRASELIGVYLAESTTRLTGAFDGTKIGWSAAYKGFWDRLRSMFTQSPITRVALIVCADKAECIATEKLLHGLAPMITWEGRTKHSEYTALTAHQILALLG